MIQKFTHGLLRRKKLVLLTLVLAGCSVQQSHAQVAYPFGFEDNVIGTWAGTASSETATINNAAANVRTGGYSLKLATTSTGTGNKQWYSNSPFLPAANNVYLHFIYWAKAQDAGTSVDASYRYASTTPPTGTGSSANASAGAALTTTGWTRVSNTVTTSSTRYYFPGPRKTVSAGATAIYIDDGILLTSASADVDTTDPGAPSGVTGNVSGNLVTLNWASNTDNGSGATGVKATLLLRTNNTVAAAPLLNDQAIYTAAGGSTGTNTIGDWTVINDNISPTATTYMDATAPPGNVKYAVVLRDLAYNYSTTAVSGTVVVGTPVPTVLMDTAGFSADFGVVVRGSQSAEQHYTLKGLNLSGNITVNAPAGFEVSLTTGTGFAASLTLPPTSGTVANTNIYVRFAPTTASGLTTADVVHSATGAVSQRITVQGTAIDMEPVHSGSISFGIVRSTRIEVNLPTVGSGNKRIIVMGNGTDVTYVPVDGVPPSGVNANYNLATAQSTGDRIVYDGNGSGNSVVTVTGLTPNTSYYFAVFEYNSGTGSSQNYLPLFPVTAVARTADNDLDVATLPLEAQIKVYPNPSAGQLFVDAPVKTKSMLTDPAGRMVYSSTEAKLDINTLAAGIYLLTVTDEVGRPLKHEKIIKK